MRTLRPRFLSCRAPLLCICGVLLLGSSALFGAACAPPLSPIPAASAARSDVSGRVTRIERGPDDELAQNVRVTLSTESGGTVSVDLAPGWVLDERGFSLKPEDQLQIEARRVGERLEATRVRSGTPSKPGPIVDLRDAAGQPLWQPRGK